MPEPLPTSPAPSARAAAMAAWLALGHTAHIFSVALSGAALVFIALARPTGIVLVCWCVVLLGGVAQGIYAARTSFDQRIFADWANAWRNPAAQPDVDMAAFDSLLPLRGASAPRPLEARIEGAMRLLRWQLAWLLAQAAAVAVALTLGIYHGVV